ncbi:uncharacterized protein Dwil_GK22278 [Drosophila willistoni]|uniref:DUF4780 domain-containing protein n=1 Tax=Drosophila willistoni TaxID=7260 RepID=B4MHH5_DROWI|nr:uncharacterized protein Dwil_GK22278 [Drosophila willistoni]
MASYSTIYDLKKRIEDLLSTSEGQCVLISSKGKELDGDLIFEAAGLENCDPKKKQTITCFQGAQKIGALTVIAEVGIETDSSENCLGVDCGNESFESVETCPDSQEVSLNKSDESSENISESLQDACGIAVKCDMKPRAPSSELDNEITLQQEKGTPAFNKGLKTEKWAVVSEEILDPCSEKNITNICLNHEVILWIDSVSVEFIKSKCYQLHYHFWKITFEFCS